MKTKEAFDVIKKAMIDDDPSEAGSYADSWHCNIAMSCYDAIMAENKELSGLAHEDTHKIANDAASRFMKLCFGVDTRG
jgi:hypothetical protein